jgi:hypothetical protein
MLTLALCRRTWGRESYIEKAKTLNGVCIAYVVNENTIVPLKLGLGDRERDTAFGHGRPRPPRAASAILGT